MTGIQDKFDLIIFFDKYLTFRIVDGSSYYVVGYGIVNDITSQPLKDIMCVSKFLGSLLFKLDY